MNVVERVTIRLIIRHDGIASGKKVGFGWYWHLVATLYDVVFDDCFYYGYGTLLFIRRRNTQQEVTAFRSSFS